MNKELLSYRILYHLESNGHSLYHTYMASTEEFSFKQLIFPVTNIKAVHWIILLGLIVYVFSLFNGFVGDDVLITIQNPMLHSLSFLPNLFTQGNVYDMTHQINNFYRPLVSVVYSFIYFFFQTTPFGYHLISLLLHIANVVLFFLILSLFVRKEIAFAVALLFLVHPLTVEAVAYMSALLDILFVFFGLSALLVFAHGKAKKIFWIVPSLLLLCSLLSKETGIVFLALLPLYAYFYKKELTISAAVESAIALGIYLLLRLGVARISFTHVYTQIIVPMQTLSFLERLLNLPLVMWYYVQNVFFPFHLVAFQSWIVTKISLQNFLFPLIGDLIFLSIIFLPIFFLSRKKTKEFIPYIFFLVWFIFSLIIHLQIIPLDQTVSDRWFYLPLLGLFGLFALLIPYVLKRFPVRVLLACGVIIFLLLAIVTIQRTQDWRSDGVLAAHDLAYGPSFQLERMLGNAYFGSGNLTQSEKEFIRSTRSFPSQLTFSGLGNFYLHTNQYMKAIPAFKKSIFYNPNLATSWAFLSVAQYDASDSAQAISSIKKAYAIAPNPLFAQILKAMQEKKSIQLY